MKIHELINNPEFSFNVEFTIYKYVPPEKNDEEGECILKYDSKTFKEDVPVNILYEDISAINQANDGTVEIEYLGDLFE